MTDPLAFTLESLASRGALVDPRADGGLAILPPALAGELGTDEEIELGAGAPVPGLTPCGFGAPLLERLIEDARAAVPVAWVRLDARPPGPAQAEAIAGRIVLRNGLVDVLDTVPAEELYVSAFFSVVAEADDRYEALFPIVLHLGQGAGEPDPALAALLDPRRSAHRLSPAEPSALLELGPLVLRARAAAEDLLAPFRESVGRRFERDVSRLEEYFASLIGDARAPRRAVSAEAIAAKVAHLGAEREQKLRDLGPRYTIQARVALAALLCARVPANRVRLRMRRRKAERELEVVIPGEVRAPDRLPCAACHRTTWRPVACDDRLHLLCETCAPSAQGRPSCGACRSRR